MARNVTAVQGHSSRQSDSYPARWLVDRTAAAAELTGALRTAAGEFTG
ncbi:hypothetical protein AB0C02_31360 [Micromonospora sp. NPDC048999]